MSEQSENDASRRNLVPLGLRNLFTELRPGEGKVVALLLSAVFFLLASAYMLKVAREAEVLQDRGIANLRGPELKALARGVQAVLLASVIIPVYSWVTSRLPRRRLMIGLTVFYALNIEVFYQLGVRDVDNLGFYFYVWVGIFNVSILAQFWSYVSDVFQEEAGKRLFPLIMVGASLGGVFGVLCDRFIGYVTYFQTNPFAPLHFTALLLLIGLGFFLWADTELAKGKLESAVQREGRRGEPLALGNGLVRVFRSPYLRLIGLLLLTLNMVNSTGEYILDKYIVAHATELASASGAAVESEVWRGIFREQVGGAWNSFLLAVNVGALLIQLFISSRVIRWFGTIGALLVLPVISFGTYALAIFGGGYLVFRALKIGENASDYSINNTAQQLLWAPTAREEKYQAKQATDTIFARLGDLLHSIMVIVGAATFELTPKDFAFANLALCVAWFAIVWGLGREYRKLRQRSTASAVEG